MTCENCGERILPGQPYRWYRGRLVPRVYAHADRKDCIEGHGGDATPDAP